MSMFSVGTGASPESSPVWPVAGLSYFAPISGHWRTQATHAADAAPAENIDIWKALDEGRDPTA
jgi:hypothetical protein